MIRIQLLHEGRVVKQISSRVHESVVLEQVKRFEHAFDEVRVLEGELSEAGKGILHHVAKKVVPAALAAGMALGAHGAHAQNNNFPGLNRSIGQHISDIVSPSYNERMRQRRYEQETERKAWDAQQNELRSARVDQARREGRAMSGHTGTKVYDQARISGDGKYFILYDMDNRITRIPTKDTEFMPGDSQRMSHYISPNGQAYYVRHTHLNESVNESHEDQVTFVIDGERAYELAMDQYGDQIDWQGEYMTAPRSVYNRIEEIVYSAGGDVEEVTGFELPEGIVTPGTIPAGGAKGGGSVVTNTPNIGNATSTTMPDEEDDTTNPDGTTNLEVKNGQISIAAPDDVEEAVDGNGLRAILDQFPDAYTAFKEGSDIDENQDFFDALYNYYSDSGEMPYDVAQGRQGDLYAWITQKLDGEAGTMPVAEGSEQEGLVSQFLKSITPKELRYYSIRDNCGPAALHMMDWAKEKGIELNRVHGYFVADNVVYDKADFTKEMKHEFLQQGLDFNDPKSRQEFIASNPKYSKEWKKVPHYWLQDDQGTVYDPTGYTQFIKTGVAKDLDKSRYETVQGVAEADKHYSNTKNPVDFPKTWHDVDKKLGKATDKMSQAEKVKKGLAHPDTLKKKGVAEGKEEYNRELNQKGFHFEQEINGVTYKVSNVKGGSDNIRIDALDQKKQVIGRASFWRHQYQEGLESLSTYVDPAWQGKGIATNMYAVMRMLGVNIHPASMQTDDGKKMWDKWRKNGDAKHIKSMNAKMTGVAEGWQNDESNLWYIYDQASQRLRQRMIHNLDEPKARSEGYRDSVDSALRVAGIIRSKFDSKKFVQNQGGKWVQVFPYGKPDVAEDIDAGADDQASADQNIIMQIRKASDYEKPTALKLADGTSVTIAPGTADKMLAKFDVLKPASKELMQNTLNTAEGFREMLNYFNEREVHENKIAMEDVDLISKHMQSFNEAEKRAKSLIKTVFGKY